MDINASLFKIISMKNQRNTPNIVTNRKDRPLNLVTSSRPDFSNIPMNASQTKYDMGEFKNAKNPAAEFRKKYGVNPYGTPGMDITNRTDHRTIVEIDEGIKQKVLEMTKSQFIEGYGMSTTEDGDAQGKLSFDYVLTLPVAERAAASWTINQIHINEAQRLVDIARKNNPSWDFGHPFDPKIFDEPTVKKGFDTKA